LGRFYSLNTSNSAITTKAFCMTITRPATGHASALYFGRQATKAEIEEFKTGFEKKGFKYDDAEFLPEACSVYSVPTFPFLKRVFGWFYTKLFFEREFRADRQRELAVQEKGLQKAGLPKEFLFFWNIKDGNIQKIIEAAEKKQNKAYTQVKIHNTSTVTRTDTQNNSEETKKENQQHITVDGLGTNNTYQIYRMKYIS
jgi:hypothetical protein